MAGKRITDLQLVPLLYPHDYFPAARDNQTIRVPGSAMVASHIYEGHKRINDYTSQKYLYIASTDQEFEIAATMNNATVAIASDVLVVKFKGGDAFPPGFRVDLVSVIPVTIDMHYPEAFSYTFLDPETNLTNQVNGFFYGGGADINPYECVRIIHGTTNTWIKLRVGGATAAAQPQTQSSTPEVVEVDLPPIVVAPPTVVVVTGNKLNLASISNTSTELVTIGNSTTTLESINGTNAYPLG